MFELLKKKIGYQEEMWFWYLKNCIMEEVFFRYILITLFGVNIVGAAVSIITYSTIHLIQFTWEMCIATFWVGLLLWFLYVIIPAPWGLIVCIAVHFVGGALLNYCGLTAAWKR